MEIEALWKTRVRGLDHLLEIYDTLGEYSQNKKYNADLDYAGRRFPCKIKMKMEAATKFAPKHISGFIDFSLHTSEEKIRFKITADILSYLRTMYEIVTFEQILAELNIYPQKEDIPTFERKVKETKDLQRKVGKHLETSAYTNEGISLANFDAPTSFIVDGDDTEGRADILPFVRGFSMKLKDYVFVHIDDLKPYVYNKDAFKKLFLPEDIRNILHTLFAYSKENVIGDIIRQKHGGLIIMAEGNPGTGKTSTAEVFAELNERPLYVIQAYELGIEIHRIEKNLETIFKRVQRWNAIILLDEADIFLYKRGNNLQQSAIVGIFLRLMDYFRGVMFLTTNKVEVIDPAMVSRITANITYPDFDDARRRQIWQSKLEDAGLQIDSLDNIEKLKLNGRQIRNMVRLAKIFYQKEIKEKDFIALMKKTLPNYHLAI